MENKPTVSCDNTECAHNPTGKACTAAHVKLRMTWVGSMSLWKLICKSFTQAAQKPAKEVYLGLPKVTTPALQPVAVENPCVEPEAEAEAEAVVPAPEPTPAPVPSKKKTKVKKKVTPKKKKGSK